MFSTLSGTAWIGVGLIAAATIAGAVLGRWSSRYAGASLAAVGGVLLAVVLGDLVPDIAHDVGGSGPAPWIAMGIGVVSFAATGVVVRRGCACGSPASGGVTAAAAIGVHRALEGSALAVTASIAIVAALVLHAGSEGFALASLLRSQERRRAVIWLLVACASPALGALALGAMRLPDQATPLVTAAVAGALARSAIAACRLAMNDDAAPASAATGQPRRAIAITTVTAAVIAGTLMGLGMVSA